MNKEQKEKELVLQGGDAARVQKAQLFHAEEQAAQAHRALNETARQGTDQDAAIAKMLGQMDALEAGTEDPDIYRSMDGGEVYSASVVEADIEMTQVIPLLKESSWEEYMASVEWYAKLEHLDLSGDPYMSLLSKAEQDAFAKQVREDFYERKPECDAIDYALAAFSGTVAGLVDIFLVGSPGDNMKNSPLGRWTDKQTDKFVKTVAKKLGWNPRSGNEDRVDLAINFLEHRAPVNYDVSNTGAMGEAGHDLLEMNTVNHHIKNLAHAPDLVGLVFSILDQFTGEIHFAYKGSLVTWESGAKQELRGQNFVEKIFCGFTNWLGHCISDIAGSSGTRRKENGERGSGLPIPGFELFQFLDIGLFQTVDRKDIESSYLPFGTLADLSVKVFENGYDARFGTALSIPVVISEMLVRLLFSIKRYFYHHKPFNECIPLNSKVGSHPHQPELRRMLLIAHGALCVWDAGDAAVQYAISGGNVLTAALHLNYFAYIRLAQDGLAELRARYRQNHIDIKAITKRTHEEWTALYAAAEKWAPLGLEDERMID